MAAAALIKRHGLPMVLNVVLHRGNIAHVPEILSWAEGLGADYLELANVQYDGWAALNREHLLPTREEVAKAEQEVAAYRQHSALKVFYVVPDYFEERPKPCAAGWASLMLVVTPDGTALPCHGARKINTLKFPNLRYDSVASVWQSSPAFNQFRGEAWMPAICRACPEKAKDFGGCRCQAFLLTGDAANADPVCTKSPHRHLIDAALSAGPASGGPRPRAYPKYLAKSAYAPTLESPARDGSKGGQFC